MRQNLALRPYDNGAPHAQRQTLRAVPRSVETLLEAAYDRTVEERLPPDMARLLERLN